jgi:hypothetical protein
MIPLYAMFLAALSAMKRFLQGRATHAERKYTRAALQAEQVAHLMQIKPGQASQDAFKVAKCQYELGKLVDERDELEQKYHGWQAKADRVQHLLKRLRNWKGQFLPYFAGVVDFTLVLVALHALGVPHGLTAETLKDWAQKLIG